MALVIEVRLLQGRYEAAALRNDRFEWPPHPARVFCALVAASLAGPEREALRWLEAQDPPQVMAPALAGHSTATGFVVTNKTHTKNSGGSQHWPGRTAMSRTRVSALPEDDRFAVVWPQADPPAEVVQALGDLAWRVPYLGRSSSPAAVRVHTAPVTGRGWYTYVPARLDARGSVDLRVPYPGYLEALDGAFAEGRRSWEESRTRAYVREGRAEPGEAAATAAAGAFADMLVFSLPPRTVRPEGSELLRLTQTLRRSVLSRVGDAAADQITGHAGPGRRHVAYLALLDVGHPRARGHVLGLGLGLPDDLTEQAHAQVRQAVAEEDGLRLRMGRSGHVDVCYEPWPSHPLRLTPRFWSGPGSGAQEWVSATPVMLDRHPRRNSDLAAMVAASLVTAGYPEPSGVEVSTAPMAPGALHRPAPGTYPPERPRRKLVHARIRFAAPVRGPVVAGSLRYLGLGLFAPAGADSAAVLEEGR